jgi:acyl dehydratase
VRKMTLYAKDLEIGEMFESDGMTITEAHVHAFAGLSGDMNPLHMNRQWAENEGPFGARIAHGMLGLAVASGLRCKLDDLALVAFLGVEDWRFRGSIFFGDTIRCRMTLAELRETSTPNRRVLEVGVDLLNQKDEAVQTGMWAMLVLQDEERGG